MYPVVEHTRTDCAARNHSRSRVPHHRTQSSIVRKNEPPWGLYLSYVPPTYEYGTRPFLRWVLSQGRSPTREAVPKMRTPWGLYLSYVPPTYEYGTRPFLRWVLSQGRSPTREAVPKMPRTPSAFPFSGRLRRRAINPTPPKRVKAWGDGPLRPEVMYPVVEHTRTDCAARNHSRSRVPHHRTQSSFAKKKKKK